MIVKQKITQREVPFIAYRPPVIFFSPDSIVSFLSHRGDNYKLLTRGHHYDFTICFKRISEIRSAAFPSQSGIDSDGGKLTW
jgi:hypothetical protein